MTNNPPLQDEEQKVLTFSAPSYLQEDASVIVKSKNFEFLRPHHPKLADLAGLAENYAFSDHSSCVVKLRTFSEFLIKAVFAYHQLKMKQAEALFQSLQQRAFSGQL